MKVVLCPQASDIWWQAKRGIPSCSNFDKIITAAKGDLSASAKSYIAELIADSVCQLPAYFTSKGTPVNNYAIEQGIAIEPEARRWLAFDAGLDVHEVGVCFTDDLRFCGSPDGLIGLKLSEKPTGEINGVPFYDGTAEAAIELKVPLLRTHAEYLMEGTLPMAYRQQVHGHMAVCGVDYVEFVSYSHELTPLRLRVERDAYTEKLQAALEQFHGRFLEAYAKVRAA